MLAPDAKENITALLKTEGRTFPSSVSTRCMSAQVQAKRSSTTDPNPSYAVGNEYRNVTCLVHRTPGYKYLAVNESILVIFLHDLVRLYFYPQSDFTESIFNLRPQHGKRRGRPVVFQACFRGEFLFRISPAFQLSQSH